MITDLSDFMLDAFERLVSLVENAEKEGLETLKKPGLKELEDKVSGFLNKMDKLLYMPVIHTDDMLYTISAERKKFLRELLHKGGDVYEVSLQTAGPDAIEIDVLDIFCKLRKIGEVAHIAADLRTLPSLQDFDPSNLFISLNFIVVTEKSAQEIEEAIWETAGSERNIRVLVSPVFPDAVMELLESENGPTSISAGEDKINEVLDLIISQQEMFYQIAETPEERCSRGDMVIDVLQKVAEYMGWIAKGESLIGALKANSTPVKSSVNNLRKCHPKK